MTEGLERLSIAMLELLKIISLHWGEARLPSCMEGKRAMNLNFANLTLGDLFELGRSAASKIVFCFFCFYVRPVGGPGNTQNKGGNPLT